MRNGLVSLVCGLMATPALAAPLSFEFNAGPLIFAAIDDPFAPPVIFDFDPFEDIIVSVVLDNATLGIPEDTTITYIDETGKISIRGVSSGAEITLTPGVEIELENANEFDISTPFIPGPKPALDFVMTDDTDFRTSVDFLSDPTDLPQVVADIQSIFPGGGPATLENLSFPSRSVISYFDTEDGAFPGEFIEEDDIFVFDALVFGPVAGAPVPVIPLPSTVWLMFGALGFLALGRRSCAGRP
ncbi:MAG: hypothetical protein AAGB05_15825 [Pseudomonadota bacterium]